MTDEARSDLELRDVLDGAAEDLPDVAVVSAGPDAVRWAVADVPFAALTAAVAEFRLDPIVVRAALRTPETATSPRGQDWVAFMPSTLDDAAIDRAEAWFLSAYRRAAPDRPAA